MLLDLMTIDFLDADLKKFWITRTKDVSIWRQRRGLVESRAACSEGVVPNGAPWTILIEGVMKLA